MGLMNFREFFGGHVPHPRQCGLRDSDRRHLEDVEAIAKSLAKQGGAPPDEWPFFVEPAEFLLQLTWEALEDAGIRPSSIAGSDVGVYVGASQTDYGHGFFGDYASADSHFATGTALAILANRISYIYDLRGPSITVDTACSSSLVAFHEAVEALRSGRIDTAIVGGINVIASPASFIAFSQASMLSPTGLCRTFSADADGFVRGEGGAVLVLRKASHAHTSKNPVHGLVLATDVNSDGRTNGISLPSMAAQEALLQRIYSRASLSPIVSLLWRRMVPARPPAIQSKRMRSGAPSGARVRPRCRLVQSRPTSAISNRRPVLPAC